METQISEHEGKPVISTKRTYGENVKEMSRGIHLRRGKWNGKKGGIMMWNWWRENKEDKRE